MLIKDNIEVIRLNYKTQNSLINITLYFNVNNTKAKLSFSYIPDKFKIEQTSILNYLNKLTSSEVFNIEDLSARVTEDLYDIAVPKKINLTIEQSIDNIETSITNSKKQPSYKS